MLSDRLLRLVGCPHPDPLSLSISDEIEPENLYFNYQSDLRICKIESGLDSSKPPGSVRFVYNHTSPSQLLIPNEQFFLLFDNVQYIILIIYPDKLDWYNQ